MKRLDRTIRYLYWIIIPILVLTVVLGIAFFAEPYRFFQDYISKLGGILSSENGPDNQVSSIVMSVGFGLCALIGFIIAILYFFSNLRYRNFKGVLNLLMAFGASCTAIPVDKGNLLTLHTIGASLFILGFGLLNFTLQLLRFSNHHIEMDVLKSREERKFDFYLDAYIVVTVFVVIFFMVIFFITSEITKNPIVTIIAITFQKLVLIVDCLALMVLDLDDI